MSKFQSLIEERDALYEGPSRDCVIDFFKYREALDRELEKPKPHSPATKKKIASLEKKLKIVSENRLIVTKKIEELSLEIQRLGKDPRLSS